MECFFRRFVETVLVEIGFSLFVFLLSFMEILTNYIAVFTFCVIFAIAYLAWTVYCLFGYRISISGKKMYYKTNFFVCFILTASAILISTAIHFVKNTTLLFILNICNYALFFPFNVFYFSGQLSGHRISFALSSTIYSVILFVVILILPVFVNKRKYLKRHWELEEETFEE